MNILSHRGYWKSNSEKNRMEAFRRSFKYGFGIETDIRDQNGCLVISHDVPKPHALPLTDMLDLYKESGESLPLALNIKACGLQNELQRQLKAYEVVNYFVFDMSVPDCLSYLNKGMRVFTRQSEYETDPSLYQETQGVWLDEFHTPWISSDVISHHSKNQKHMCIVSPELHGRDYVSRWKEYKKLKTFFSGTLMLCTDYPEQARGFFDV